MRSKLVLFNLIVMVAVISVAQSPGRAQSPSPNPSPNTSTSDTADPDQENTRGAFLTSRPKTVEKPAKNTTTAGSQPRTSRRRPRTTTQSSTSGTTATIGTTTTGTSTKKTDGDAKKKPVAQKMGLGFTLFMRDANGLGVRVDPTHEFHKGDRVRVLLETNTDGHLYIFNTTDDGRPVMIYPDPQLDDAGNYLQAHVPLEIPSSVVPEENLRWFRFDENQGVERLYFVFTREPLADAPIEDDLVKYCAEDKTQCAWHPSPEMWTQLRKQVSIPSAAAKAKSDGQTQTTAEQQAATRGIGLARNDPEPSLVMMNASTESALLVAELDLFHR